MIRLIAFDMDGTVLNDEKKILKETKEALEQADVPVLKLCRRPGGHFVVFRMKSTG